MSLQINETYSRSQVGKLLSDMFPINSGLKQGDGSLSLFLNFVLEYAIKRVQVNVEGLKLNGAHQRLCYVMLLVLIYWEEVYYKEKHKHFSSYYLGDWTRSKWW